MTGRSISCVVKEIKVYTERSWEFLTVLNENAEKHSIFIKSPGILSRDGYSSPIDIP
jgi:hypothetical protein